MRKLTSLLKLRNVCAVVMLSFPLLASGQARFIVADKGNKRIYLYNESVAALAPAFWNTPAANDTPDDVYVSNTYLYVLDSADRLVYRYASYAGGTPTATRTLARAGSNTQIGNTYGMVVDETADELWVCDTTRLYRYSLSSAFSAGGVLRAANEYLLGANNSKPTGLAIDSTYVYITDQNDRIFYRRPRANPITITASARTLQRSNSTNLDKIDGAVLEGNTMWVLDSDVNSIHSFPVSSLFSGSGNLVASASINLSGPSESLGIGLNPIPSVISITRAEPDPTNASSVTFNVTFSEPVTGVDPTDFTLTTTDSIDGASVTSTGTDSGATRVVTVSTGTGSGTIRLDFPDVDDTVVDSGAIPIGGAGAGNGSYTAGEFYTIDRSPPSVVGIVPATVGPTNANSVSFEVAFSEDVSGFDDASDVIVTHAGTADSDVSVSGSGDTYTVTVSGITGDGSFTVEVDTTSDVEDALGNSLVSGGLSAAVAIDNTSPTVTSITASTTGPTNADTVTFEVVFSEPVHGFDDELDVVVNHSGTTSTTVAVSEPVALLPTAVSVSGSNDTYLVTVSEIAGDGTLTIEVSTSSDVTDVAGNSVEDGGAGDVVVIDNTAPRVESITPLNGQELLITYDEANEMTTGALTAEFYTISGPGQGPGISDTPDSVEHVLGNTYKLIWNSGTMINGQAITVTVNTEVADVAGNQLAADADSAQSVALPVSLSGFAVD